jgi:hypothetical protein
MLWKAAGAAPDIVRGWFTLFAVEAQPELAKVTEAQ